MYERVQLGEGRLRALRQGSADRRLPLPLALAITVTRLTAPSSAVGGGARQGRHRRTVTDGSAFDLEPLAAEVRRLTWRAEAERTIWTFEHALAAGRVDDELLGHLLAAVTCLIGA